MDDTSTEILVPGIGGEKFKILQSLGLLLRALLSPFLSSCNSHSEMGRRSCMLRVREWRLRLNEVHRFGGSGSPRELNGSHPLV
jgi:hypothetical protein